MNDRENNKVKMCEVLHIGVNISLEQAYELIDTVPYGEDCVQVGDDNFYEDTKKESSIFIQQLKRKFPGIDRLGITIRNVFCNHDFGYYNQIILIYNRFNEEQRDLVNEIVDGIPENWDEQAIIARQAYKKMR